MRLPLREIAHARSGDKGSSANIGLIAYQEAGYPILLREVTSERVQSFFKKLNAKTISRYELPNLHALNFWLEGVLDGGGSESLRIDSQGKVLGQALLEMEIELSEEELKLSKRGKTHA